MPTFNTTTTIHHPLLFSFGNTIALSPTSSTSTATQYQASTCASFPSFSLSNYFPLNPLCTVAVDVNFSPNSLIFSIIRAIYSILPHPYHHPCYDSNFLHQTFLLPPMTMSYDPFATMMNPMKFPLMSGISTSLPYLFGRNWCNMGESQSPSNQRNRKLGFWQENK